MTQNSQSDRDDVFSHHNDINMPQTISFIIQEVFL